MLDFKVCPDCGQRCVLNMTICGRCGHDFYPERTVVGLEDRRRFESWRGGMIASTILILWLLVCALTGIKPFPWSR